MQTKLTEEKSIMTDIEDKMHTLNTKYEKKRLEISNLTIKIEEKSKVLNEAKKAYMQVIHLFYIYNFIINSHYYRLSKKQLGLLKLLILRIWKMNELCLKLCYKLSNNKIFQADIKLNKINLHTAKLK